MQRVREFDLTIRGRAIEDVAIGSLGVEHQPVHIKNHGGELHAADCRLKGKREKEPQMDANTPRLTEIYLRVSALICGSFRNA